MAGRTKSEPMAFYGRMRAILSDCPASYSPGVGSKAAPMQHTPEEQEILDWLAKSRADL